MTTGSGTGGAVSDTQTKNLAGGVTMERGQHH